MIPFRIFSRRSQAGGLPDREAAKVTSHDFAAMKVKPALPESPEALSMAACESVQYFLSRISIDNTPLPQEGYPQLGLKVL